MAVKRGNQFRSFDAFAKPIDGVRHQTVTGGVITVLASTSAIVLFFSQIYMYLHVDTRNHFSLAESFPLSFIMPSMSHTNNSVNRILLQAKREGSGMPADRIAELSALERSRIDVAIHITFPYIKCANMDYAHDAASLSNGKFVKMYGKRAFTKRQPNSAEWEKVIGHINFAEDKAKLSTSIQNACTIKGEISVPRIGGEITLSLDLDTWHKVSRLKDKNGMNVNHYIHNISFGTQFPLYQNPLSESMDTIENKYHVGVTNIMVKLIPTKYKRFARRSIDTYQTSVTKFAIQPNTLASQNSAMTPGLSIHYDFTPLAVHHIETRENIFVFLGSLISIVGGVFVTVGLVSSCLITATTFGKKID
mmetsp:Transcript_14122/g.20166  ORF Transcript_14122/g.20166 Transcript_14122/m.20166 type:complete len:363 (-) Transcript_14122:255-1343(-)|eukprot:CAMPEP_0184869882 /NCGR_PEP_ID=MMETSP0580-20130426/35692_1 /TAXON_ID=1118495 /ORGANISM="Dactyliosolen fragilissimus" /LENGTH=362 /DNA_ID=CAMNT_0027371675 /DNA_START=123 /DNA_END=1211 /DNA_ORIENTATION=+